MSYLVIPDLRTRQSKAAQDFMRRKGYDLRPVHYLKIIDQNVWYYYYDLAEGLLELEVELDSDESPEAVKVTAFVTGKHSELISH